MTRNSSVAVRIPSMAQSVFEQRIVNGLPPSRTIWHARLLRGFHQLRHHHGDAQSD
jgi:hypothetical protein